MRPPPENPPSAALSQQPTSIVTGVFSAAAPYVLVMWVIALLDSEGWAD